MFKKFFLVTLFSVLFSLFSTQPAHAVFNPDPVLQDYCQARSGDVVNLETWYSGKCFQGATGDATPVTGQYRGFSDIVLLDLLSKLAEFAGDPTQLVGMGNDNGLVPSLALLTARIATTPPASSTDYLAGIRDNLQKHSLVQPAYAQEGFGFTSLQPVLKAWRGMRNIAYSAYILVFLLYGFMIMFRVKIDPKVVTSFQLAIPKLIVTLLLITFSYAIAGLVIDLSYLISLIIGTALETAGLIDLSLPPILRNLSGVAAVDNLLEARTFLTGNGLGFMGLGLLVTFKLFISDAVNQIFALLTGIPVLVTSVIVPFVAISLIVKIILILALAYTMFKIFFVFLQAYAKIILSIIFSPIILLGNVMPGNDAFGGWVRGLIAEISVFPTVIIMMMLGATFIDTGFFGLGGGNNEVSGTLWLPPGFGNQSLFPGSDPGKGASALIGFAILLLTPKIADMIKDALSIKPFKYGAAIGEGLWPVALAQKTISGATQKGLQEKALAATGALFGAATARQGQPIQGPTGVINVRGRQVQVP